MQFGAKPLFENISVKFSDGNRYGLIPEDADRSTVDLQNLIAAESCRNGNGGRLERLIWMHYGDALYYMGYGARGSARKALARGLELQPESSELLAMQRRLSNLEEKGAIDVVPFLPGAMQ